MAFPVGTGATTAGRRTLAPTARAGGLPDFVVIGAMKAGSTSLWRYLREHPQVRMTDPKELHYFVAERNLSRGIDWYRSHFPAPEPGIVCGEASVTYTKAEVHPGVPQRMASVLPGARLVYLVRDPVARMRSHYVHEVAALRETLPVERALREQPRYLDVSRYAAQLDHFLLHYPEEQVLVLTSESLRVDPAAALGRVLSFLGVDADWVPPVPITVNGSHRKGQPGPLAHRLASSPAARSVVRRIPVPLREVVKDHLPRRPLDPARSALPEDLVAEIRDALRDDVRRLRRFAGSDLDVWGIT